MRIDSFYNWQSSLRNAATVSARQGSAFAKDIAGDFNPLHDEQSRRFCVPGDLLFAIALNECGLYQNMKFEFLGLVNADLPIQFFSETASELSAVDQADRSVLRVSQSGDIINADDTVANFILQYVQFSGKNFPDILVPLMQKHGVMINPRRPTVIYQQMQFSIDNLHPSKLELRLTDTTLEHDGRRGTAILSFDFSDGEQVIGAGSKQLLLSGLRVYDKEALEYLTDEYYAKRDAWSAQANEKA